MNREEKLEQLLNRVLTAQRKIALPEKDGPNYYIKQKEIVELVNDISYAIKKRPAFYIKVNGGIEELDDNCTPLQVIETGIERYWDLDEKKYSDKGIYNEHKQLQNTLIRLFEANEDEDFLKQLIYKDSRLVRLTKKFIERREEIYKSSLSTEMEITASLIHDAQRVEGCENNDHNKRNFDSDFDSLLNYLKSLRKEHNREFVNCLNLAEKHFPQQMLIEAIL